MENKKQNDTYVVYKHTNKINGKIYVGQTCLKPEQRWENGGKGYEIYSITKNGNKKPSRFWSAIQKYGWENFEHKILIHGLTKEQADIWEKRLIKTWDLMNSEKGYNLRGGGSNGRHSEESKRKMSESRKGKYTKENSYWHGKHLSEETKRRISESRKEGIASGRIKVRKGFKNSEITRKKISKSRLGIEPWNKGKTGVYSDETRKKMSQNHADVNREKNPRALKTVRLKDGKMYNCMLDCAKDSNVSAHTVRNHCKNYLKTGLQDYMYYEDWIKLQEDS